MALRGSAYLTHDLDIAYERSDENIARLVAALRPLRPRLRVGEGDRELDFVFDEHTIRNGMNFALGTDAGNVDIFGRVAGYADFDDVKRSSEPLELDHGDLLVLTLDGLIRAKQASGRTKDRLALPELEALREAQFGRSPNRGGK
jgi:hypothetical protein